MCLNCHVVTVNVEIKSLEALVAACHRLGWEFHHGRTDHCWYGRWVDDSPVPRNLFATEDEYQSVVRLSKPARQTFMKALLDKCDHVIRVPNCTYEIGVFRVGDHYSLSYDWEGDLNEVLGRPGGIVVNPLPQAYAVELEKLTAANMGFACMEQVQEDGAIKLTICCEG